jgi:hypothetical protein
MAKPVTKANFIIRMRFSPQGVSLTFSRNNAAGILVE